MRLLNHVLEERASAVRFDDHRLMVELVDGRAILVPLDWFPRLASGTAEQRANWELTADGHGIYWPELDEDLSTAGLLRGAVLPFE